MRTHRAFLIIANSFLLRETAGESASSVPNFSSVAPASPSATTHTSPTYFPKHTIPVHEGSKIHAQNKEEFIAQVRTFIDILNKNKDAISKFDQEKYPDHSSYIGDGSFSISIDAFKHAIDTYGTKLRLSLLYQHFEAMQTAHAPNQPWCGLSRIAINIQEMSSPGYIHTHGDFDGGWYTACAVPLKWDSSVGTQFAQGTLEKQDADDSGGDTVYIPGPATDIQVAPSYEIYSIDPKTPHGEPKSDGRIFVRVSSEQPFNHGERWACFNQALRAWFGLGVSKDERPEM
jgi:hypothetical protein